MEPTRATTTPASPTGAEPRQASKLPNCQTSADAERLSAWAASWCDNHARWQVVRHRWGVKGVKTLVRVADNPPLECMRQLLDFLRSEAGCAQVWANGKDLGADWRPMGAWYEEARAEDGTQAVTLRVYQALRDKQDGEAEGPFLVQDGCLWKISHTFYWDVPEVLDAPASSSGVAYEVQGIRRDDGTGLFSYVLVRRERVAVEVGPWLAHQDAFEDRARALLLGLREEEGGSVDDKVAAFAQKAGMTLEDGGGVTVDVQKSKNDDCTTDVTIENAAEQAVPSAAVTVAEDAFGKRTTVLDRNQTAAAETAFERSVSATGRNVTQAAAAPEAPSAANGNALTRAENAKTPGGRYVASVTTTTPKPAQLALTLAKKDGRQVKRLWFRNQSADWVARQAQGYTDGSAQQNDFGLYDGSFQLVLTDEGDEGGDRISIPTHENAFQEVRCNDEVDREQGVIHRVTYTSTVVEGVLNDNADAAYAKCAGSVGPASVNYLGGRTVEQGGRGYYSYRYVASVKTHTEDIPLSTTDSASGHVMGAGA